MGLSFLMHRVEDFSDQPGSLLVGLCALECGHFATCALEKGATRFDFNRLIPPLKSAKHADWVVMALKIDVSSHHLTAELSRKLNMDVLEFLFDRGIGSLSRFDHHHNSTHSHCLKLRNYMTCVK
jgi:hypothetical protein